MESRRGSVRDSTPWFHGGDKSRVCKLKKALYGLKQAPRAWHKKLSTELESLGFKACRSDPGLFIKTESPESRIFVLAYVDDLLIILMPESGSGGQGAAQECV